ncbi:hypothetical protein BJ978_003212 [Agromyces terreus]|uniref:Uncharacterized protein n=1 Tax=Agromyces terreus TaxID=424795 RepID=A0A9X2KDK1_9MICO|nr:hypothetical protein [Agromyces terreus]
MIGTLKSWNEGGAKWVAQVSIPASERDTHVR